MVSAAFPTCVLRFSFLGRVCVCPIVSGASLQAFRYIYISLTYQPVPQKRKVTQELLSLYIQEMFLCGSAASFFASIFLFEFLLAFCAPVAILLRSEPPACPKTARGRQGIPDGRGAKAVPKVRTCSTVRQRLSKNPKAQGWAGERSSCLLKCQFFL